MEFISDPLQDGLCLFYYLDVIAAFHVEISASNNRKDFLENELKVASSTVQSLQETVSSSQVSCEELLVQLTELQNERESSDKVTSELTAWQSQVKNLEATLENAKSESEKKAQDLYTELEAVKSDSEKRIESSRYILPAATATGALAAAGLMLILKTLTRR